VTQQPLISVLIPAYNAERFIATCLDSVVGQSYANIEVVVVNDGSTDNTSALLHDYAARDGRVRVIDKANEGVMLTRKRCIEEARGEWLFFVDADDNLASDIIAKLYSAVTASGCDIASGTLLRVKKGYTTSLWKSGEITDGEGFIGGMITGKIYSAMIGRLYRHTLFEGLYYYPEISMGEDLLLNIQVAMRPEFGGICFVPDAIYHYVQWGSSLSHKKVSFDYQELFAARFDGLFARRPDFARHLQSELLHQRIMLVHTYIKRSSNPWMGDRPLAKEAYRALRDHCHELRQTTSLATLTMVELYRWRWLKPLVVVIATFQRWGQSITRRLAR
jgi:glycosyltransferase involved in cell wall biosynthesis